MTGFAAGGQLDLKFQINFSILAFFDIHQNVNLTCKIGNERAQ